MKVNVYTKNDLRFETSVECEKNCETSGFQGYFALNNDVVLVLRLFSPLGSHLPAVLPLALLSPSRKQAIHCQIASLA